MLVKFYHHLHPLVNNGSVFAKEKDNTSPSHSMLGECIVKWGDVL
jgi:hypothetical protein